MMSPDRNNNNGNLKHRLDSNTGIYTPGTTRTSTRTTIVVTIVVTVLFSTWNIILSANSYNNNVTQIILSGDTIYITNIPFTNTTTTVTTTPKWSDVKLAIYMTTHLPGEHLRYLPCWEDAIQRLQIFKYAHLILYVPQEPTFELLQMLPFPKVIVKLYNNTGYQSGAIQAMIDPFTRNVPEDNTTTTTITSWFDEYDWVIRLNPDVLIRNDTWLMETMLNPHIDGIFHECWNSKNTSKVDPVLHSDFYALRPVAMEYARILNTSHPYAEEHLTLAVRNIYDSGRIAYVEGAYTHIGGHCRIEGAHSPVVHAHDVWSSCPYYYNVTKENIYRH